MKKAIYKIVNNVNGKLYIGQSVDPQHRFVAHCSRAINDSDNSPIHKAIKKYGKENFSMEVLEWTKDYNLREQELIKKYKSYSPYGYNVAIGGEEPPHSYGEDHHKSVITDEQVSKVIEYLKYSELTEPKIGEQFTPHFNQVLINNINWGITHRREEESYPIRKTCPYNLTKEEVEEIKWLLINTPYPCSQIANHYHVNTSTIKHINCGRSYFENNSDYPLRKKRGKKQTEPVEAILAKRSTDTIDTYSEMGVCT